MRVGGDHMYEAGLEQPECISADRAAEVTAQRRGGHLHERSRMDQIDERR